MSAPTGQRWVIRTTTRADNDDSDVLSFVVDEEYLPHAITLSPESFNPHNHKAPTLEILDDRNFIWSWYDQEYDRSAEVYYPVFIEQHCEFLGLESDDD